MKSNDELGEQGEDHFKLICSEVGLVCNKSQQDRIGWDYLVEEKFREQKAPADFDTRQRGMSCHVQVKTVRLNTKSISVRLSSAEYLAKEQKPSFFCIFRANNKDQIVEAYIIHLLNMPLEKILKRLREAEVSEGKINEIYINFSISRDSTKIKPTGSAIVSTLQELCGSDPHAYITEKIKQLRTLGYTERPISISFTVRLPNPEDVSDFLLGLKKDVPIENYRESENRFGIAKLKQEFLTGTTLTLTPTPINECKLIIRHPSFLEAITLDAKIYVPPVAGIPEDKLKIIVRSDFIEIERKGYEYTLSLKPMNDSPQSLDSWKNYSRAQLILGMGGGSIEITDGKLSSVLELDSAMQGICSSELCKQFLERVELLQKLFALAGVKDKNVTLAELDECQTIQSMCVEEVHEFEGVSFKMPRTSGMEESLEKEILLISNAIFGEKRLLHIAIAKVHSTFESEIIRLKFLSVVPKEVKLIDKAEEVYAEALSRASQTYKLEWTIKSEPKKVA